MSSAPNSKKRTYELAVAALQHIRSHNLSATPKNFEVWYSYAQSESKDIQDTINKLVSENEPITEHDLENIYDQYFNQAKLSDAMGELSAKLSKEMESISAQIDSAAGAADVYGKSLESFGKNVSSSADATEIKKMIETLVAATAEMQNANQALEKQLSDSKSEVNSLKTNLETVRTESLTDQLTMLNNRKFFDQQMIRLIQDAQENNTPLTLMMTDIDHFKSFNDTWGHQTGDQVLRLVAMALKQNVKGQDVAARYGGEEFAVILPNTPLRAGITVGEHIRKAIMSRELVKKSTGQQIGRVTISIGVATFKPGDTVASMIERADMCLYAAKRNGRNRVICETDKEYDGKAKTKVA